MTESDFWTDHVSVLKNFGKLKRLEDLLDKGTPDVVYCLRWLHELPRSGWIELKKLPRWPGERTDVRLPHYSVAQAEFLESWGKSGSGAFLLAQIGSEFLLFPWAHAKEIQRGVTRAIMRGMVVAYGSGEFPTRDILRCLTRT